MWRDPFAGTSFYKGIKHDFTELGEDASNEFLHGGIVDDTKSFFANPGTAIGNFVEDNGPALAGSGEIVQMAPFVVDGMREVTWFDTLFSRPIGLLNKNDYLRIGVGWNASINSKVFRIAVGNGRWWIHSHLDLWKIQ